jgi:hypothetical protein
MKLKTNDALERSPRTAYGEVTLPLSGYVRGL